MQPVGILQYGMLYVSGRHSFCLCLSGWACVWISYCAHCSVRFLMYSSVELSCSRSISKPKVCFEAFTALLATASMWSAVSLWLRGREGKKKEDKVNGGGGKEKVSNIE